jgi:glycosyltransferase involved in cell wall biosynthesis
MNEAPAVSVVIATYNYAHYLPSALDSVLAQTVKDLEVIVVDDGSTDDTQDVMREYGELSFLRYVRTENRGQPAAENTGVRQARAPWVAFLDADDQWLPAKIEKQLALARNDPDLGVVYSRRLWVDPAGCVLDRPQPVLHRGEVLETMFLRNFVCFSSSMVRRGVFDTVGLFDERRRNASDYDLWLRAAMRFRFDYVDEPLVKYRVGHPSLAQRNTTHSEAVLAIIEEFLEKRGGRSRLDPKVVRRGLAETYAHLGLNLRDGAKLAAFGAYSRAILSQPTYRAAWLGLAGVAFPEHMRRRIRRLLGRPSDWQGPTKFDSGETPAVNAN